MHIYDGSRDRKAPITNHTILVVSANRIVGDNRDLMTIRKKGREDWSLFYCERGKICFEEATVSEGQMWIYPPNVPQKYIRHQKDNTIYHYLHFTGSDVALLLKELKIEPMKIIEVKSESVLEIFDRIQKGVAGKSALSALKAEYHTLQLLSKIAKPDIPKPATSIMKRVTDNMEHTFSDDYNPEHYAKMFNVSVSRFNHMFKEYMGISPYNYYINLRISNACSLLENTELKILDIAQKCGYLDPLYFTQAFKSKVGLTPSQYRKQNRLIK